MPIRCNLCARWRAPTEVMASFTGAYYCVDAPPPDLPVLRDYPHVMSCWDIVVAFRHRAGVDSPHGTDRP